MYVINFGGSTGVSYRQCVHEDKRTLVLPSQLMDFLRVIDKHTKKPTTVKRFDHCADGTGEFEEKGRTALGKTLHLTSVFKQNGKLCLR